MGGRTACCVGGLFRLGFSKHVDTPKPLVSSELPRDNCTPSVVDGACGQNAVSTSPFFLLTLLPHPFPHSCFLVLFGFAPLPRKPTPMFGLFTSRCVRSTYWECPFFFFLLQMHVQVAQEPGGRWCAHVWVWVCGELNTLASRKACCDVIDCFSHYHSESALSVGTPPPSALRQHQSWAAACSERRGCWYYYEGRGTRKKGGCGDGSVASVLSWVNGFLA